MSDLKSNINQIHSQISQKFENVTITEMDSKIWGKYFQITVNESLQVKMTLPLNDVLNSNSIRWYYESNPSSPKNSSLVERHSNINDIANHVKDIIDNRRFDSSYLTTYVKS